MRNLSEAKDDQSEGGLLRHFVSCRMIMTVTKVIDVARKPVNPLCSFLGRR